MRVTGEGFMLNIPDDEDDLREDVEPLEEDEEAEEEDPDVVSGKVCAVCGTEFTQANGKLAVCGDCYGGEQAESLPLSLYPEKV